MLGILGDVFGGHAAKGLRIESAVCSERGLVRPDNQDSFFKSDEQMVYCVADGMGGGEGGAKASSIVAECVRKAVESHKGDYGERVKSVADAIREANAEIRAYAQKMNYRQMATTATVLMSDPDDATEAVIGYVGDSRVYRFRDGHLAQVTRDHTLAEELKRMARLNIPIGVDGRASRLSHVLTRAVGIEDEVTLDWRRIDLREGDTVIISSDGLYDVLPDDEIRRLLSEGGTPEAVVRRLSDSIVQGGAIDNYTIILLKVGGGR